MKRNKLLKTLLSWAPTLIWAGIIFFLSSMTWDDAPSEVQVNDKVAHLVLFAVLGATLAWGGRHHSRGWAEAGLVLLGFLYGLSDEWHQSFVPGRDPSMGDLLADGVGVLLGFLLGRALFRWKASSNEERNVQT